MLPVYEWLVYSAGDTQEKEDCLVLALTGFPEKSVLEEVLQHFQDKVEQASSKQWWKFDFSHLSLLDWESFKLLGEVLGNQVNRRPPVKGVIFVLPENPFVRVWLEEVLRELEEEVPVYYVNSCKEARLLMEKVF